MTETLANRDGSAPCPRRVETAAGASTALLYGGDSERVWLFVHGKNGCKEEAAAFAQVVCPKGWQVLSADLPEHGERKAEPGFDPWRAVPELGELAAFARKEWKHTALRANSIGAWFSMQAMKDDPPERALFVSPILDMEQLIRNMMLWARVDESRLQREGEIPTQFGETLSWEYLRYAAENPVAEWAAPTAILYGSMDGLTPRATAEAFARREGRELTVMEGGEHWFHTPKQLAFLRDWEEKGTGIIS